MALSAMRIARRYDVRWLANPKWDFRQFPTIQTDDIKSGCFFRPVAPPPLQNRQDKAPVGVPASKGWQIVPVSVGVAIPAIDLWALAVVGVLMMNGTEEVLTALWTRNPGGKWVLPKTA